MRVRLTHLLDFVTSGGRAPDALARAVEPPQARLFVPGWLPCGECGLCRRGLAAACPRAQRLTATVDQDLPDRFLAPIDDPALDDRTAVCAGLVAEAIDLAARAGLGAGDIAVWLGDDPRCTLGARLSAARGARVFHLNTAAPPSTGVTALSFDADPGIWRAALADATSGAPGGFSERRLFLASAAPTLVAAAIALADPGTRIALLDADGTATLPLTLPLCRILTGSPAGYHPDFVPESLAALARHEVEVADLLGSPALAITAL